jgi:ligand-binding SRPBCC domain-containing protein
MTVYSLTRTQFLPPPPEEVFRFFENPENLAAITPEWLSFRILTPPPIDLKVGTLIDYSIRWLGLGMRWRTMITTYDPPRRFVDEQLRGPYSLWHHTHSFRSVEGGTEMTDLVRYMLPCGVLGELAHRFIVRRQLDAIFDHRARVIAGVFTMRRREAS